MVVANITVGLEIPAPSVVEFSDSPASSKVVYAELVGVPDGLKAIAPHSVGRCDDSAGPSVVDAGWWQQRRLLQIGVVEAEHRKLCGAERIAVIGIALSADAGRGSTAHMDSAYQVVNADFGPGEPVLRFGRKGGGG